MFKTSIISCKYLPANVFVLNIVHVNQMIKFIFVIPKFQFMEPHDEKNVLYNRSDAK